MRTLTLVVCVCVCGEVLLAVQVDLLHFSIAAEIESIRVWFVLGSRLWLDIATCENDLYLCSLTCCVLWVMNSTHLSRLCVPRWSSSVCTAIDAQSSTVLYTYWNSETSFFRSLWKHLVLGGKQTLRPCGLPAHSEAVGVGGFWIDRHGTQQHPAAFLAFPADLCDPNRPQCTVTQRDANADNPLIFDTFSAFIHVQRLLGLIMNSELYIPTYLIR